jgi:hypothetical protein
MAQLASPVRPGSGRAAQLTRVVVAWPIQPASPPYKRVAVRVENPNRLLLPAAQPAKLSPLARPTVDPRARRPREAVTLAVPARLWPGQPRALHKVDEQRPHRLATVHPSPAQPPARIEEGGHHLGSLRRRHFTAQPREASLARRR